MQVWILILILFIIGIVLLYTITSSIVIHNSDAKLAVKGGIEDLKNDSKEKSQLSRRTLEERLSAEEGEIKVLGYVKKYLVWGASNSRAYAQNDQFQSNFSGILAMSTHWKSLCRADKRFLERDEQFYQLEEDFVTQIRSIDSMRVSGVFVHDQLISILAQINKIATEMKQLMMMDLSPKQYKFKSETHTELIEEMRELSTRQLKTGEGDQEIAKLSNNIVTLYDDWNKVFSTDTIDEYKEILNNIWELVDDYKNAMRGQGSFAVVTDNYARLRSIVDNLTEIAKVRQERQNKLSKGLELESLEKVVENTLAQETAVELQT